MESSEAVRYSFEGVPHAAIGALLRTLQEYGVGSCATDHDDGKAGGTFWCDAGSGSFTYEAERLTVTILRDKGHFSRLMIKGGLRQLVGEAVEQHMLASPLSSADVEPKRSTV